MLLVFDIDDGFLLCYIVFYVYIDVLAGINYVNESVYIVATNYSAFSTFSK
jgi:hypothetical protein